MGRITGVKCTVDECTYWGTGNVCEADAIEVNTNPTGKRAGTGGTEGADMEVGRIGEQGTRGGARAGKGGEAGARVSEETMCKTFRRKPAGYGR